MNIRSGITAVILLCATLTFAQAPSVYSKLGIGIVENTPTPTSLGLNQSGVALNDGDFLSCTNPASFGSVSLTRLAISMEFNGDFVRRFFFGGVSIKLGDLSPDFDESNK